MASARGGGVSVYVCVYVRDRYIEKVREREMLQRIRMYNNILYAAWLLNWASIVYVPPLGVWGTP